MRIAEAWGPLSRPIRASAVLSQHAGDSVVLLHLEGGRYFSLDRVGVRIWELCDGVRTLPEIVTAVCDQYGADPAVVWEDTLELLTQLASAALISEAQ